MKFLNKFKIRTKVLASFIIVLLLTAFIGSVALIQSMRAEANVTRLADDLAVEQHVADDIAARIWQLRFYAAQYIALQDQSVLVNYQSELENFQSMLGEADALVTDPERRDMLAAIHTDVEAYSQTVTEIGDIIFRRKTVATDTLDPQGLLAQSKLEDLRRGAFNKGKALPAYYAGTANQYLQFAQVSASKYLERGTPTLIQQFNQRYEQAQNAFNRLDNELKDPDQRQLAQEARTAFDTYAQAFTELQADYQTQAQLVTKLNALGLQVGDKGQQMADSVAAEFQETKGQTHTDATTMRWQILLALVVAIVIGLALAWVTAQGIIGPVRVVMNAAFSMAEGDISQIETIDSQDEIGAMSNAFRKMVIYLQGMVTAAQRLANGDLSTEVVPLSEKDLLGNAFAQMIDNLHNMVEQVRATALTVADASAQLMAAAAQSGEASEQIAATLQQVAQGTASQAAGMTRATDTVNQVVRAVEGVAQGAQEQAAAAAKTSDVTAQVAHIIQQVAESAQSGADGSAHSIEAAREGAETIAQVVDKMQNIHTTVELIGQRVREMGQRSEQVGVIVETIDDIAAQTNLLALNAAIEAARAGEHGKGFAVVADEVRKLAEKSATAAGEIANLVKAIRQTAVEAAHAMDEGVAAVAGGVTQADQSGEALHTILQSAEGVNKLMIDIATAAQQMNIASDQLIGATEAVSAVIEENTAATQEMTASASEVMDVIEGIASISEENSAAVEEVSAAAEEMNAQVTEVAASANKLDEMAKAMQQMVAAFKLDSDDVIIDDGVEEAATEYDEQTETNIEYEDAILQN